MKHSELVERAEKWLRNSKHCSVVIKEFVSSACETPDVIGWKQGASILIECKTSRSDFNNEYRKPHRRNGVGMGRERYFFVPTGLLEASEVLGEWGLLFCSEKQVKIVKESTPLSKTEYCVAEYPLLLSIARRIELRGLMENIRDVKLISTSLRDPRDTEQKRRDC